MNYIFRLIDQNLYLKETISDDLVQAYEFIGLIPESELCYSSDELSEYFKKHIVDNLAFYDREFVEKLLNRSMKIAVYNYLKTKQQNFNEYYKILSVIRDMVGQNEVKVEKVDFNIRIFEKIIKYAIFYYKFNQYEHHNLDIGFTRDEDKVFFNNIINLSQTYDFIKLHNGKVKKLDETVDKLSEILLDKIKSFNPFKFFYYLEYEIEKLYPKTFYGMHIISRNTGQIPVNVKTKEFDAPYGYLINLSVSLMKSELHIPSDFHLENKSYKNFQEIITLARKIFGITGFQKFSIWAYVYQYNEDRIKFFQDNVLFDTIFLLRQYSENFVLDFSWYIFNIQPAFSEYIQLSLHKVFQIYIGLMTLFKNNKNRTVFSRKEIIDYLKREKIRVNLNNFQHQLIKKTDVLRFLDLFSINISDVNDDFKYTSDFKVSYPNYYLKLLLKTDKSEIIRPNIAVQNFGFFEVLYANLRKSKNDIEGEQIEDYLKNLLNKKGINFKSGYYFPKNSLKEECDIVIETPNKIFFIELKKKTLTSKSLAGNELFLLKDLSDSLLYSQIQCLKHEINLIKNGKIDFRDEENKVTLDTLEYDKKATNLKSINRISLTLYNYECFHDRTFTTHFLELFATSELKLVNSGDKDTIKILNKINENAQLYKKKITELHELLKILKIFKLPDDDIRYTHFSFFFSLDFLTMIINDSASNQDFENNFNRISNVMLGNLNYFRTYAYMKGMTVK